MYLKFYGPQVRQSCRMAAAAVAAHQNHAHAHHNHAHVDTGPALADLMPPPGNMILDRVRMSESSFFSSTILGPEQGCPMLHCIQVFL